MTEILTSKTQKIIKKPNPFFEKAFDTIFGITLIALLAASIVFTTPYLTTVPLQLGILFLNGLLSIYGMLTSVQRKASIHFVSFLFCYLFLSLAPIMQIGADADPVFHLNTILLKASLISFFFVLAGVFFINKISTPNNPHNSKETIIREGRYILLFIATLALASICLAIFKDSLFTSREGFNNAVGQIFNNQAIALVAINLLKLSPFFGASIGFRAAWVNKNNKMLILFGFLLIIAAIINNPMANPRFFLAGLAFFFVDYMTRGRNVRILAILIIIGIFTAPLFHTFRRNAQTVTIQHERSLLEETLISMDYDAFQLANYTILTTEQTGISWGNNLLGALLFFAPRAIWQSKPPPTPHIIYETMIKYRTVGTNNLSTPLVAEGFFAFSWIGAIGISILYWYGITLLMRQSLKDTNGGAFLLRCVMVGLTLILLRGSLMIGISSVVGFAFAALIPWLVFYFGTQDTKHQKHKALI